MALNEWFDTTREGFLHRVLIKTKASGKVSMVAGAENLPFRHTDQEAVARYVRRTCQPCEPPPQALPEDR